MLLFRLLFRYPKAFVLIVGVAICIYGGIAVSDSVSNPTAKPISIAQLEAQHPTSGWYHVTGGMVDLGQATGLDSLDAKVADGEAPSSIVVPVWSPSDAQGSKSTIYLKTSSPALIAAANPKAGTKTMDFSGLIESSDSSDHTVASSMNRDGGNDIVLDEGSAPTPVVLGVLMIVAGLAIIAGGIVLFVKKTPLWGNHGAAAYQAPRNGAYTPGSFPQQGGYPPQQGNYPPQGGYPPQPGGYPPQGNYPPQPGAYPPQVGYPPQQGGYPPQGQYPQAPPSFQQAPPPAQGGEPPAGPSMDSLPPYGRQ